jgi:hypothetical protein
MHVLQLPSYGLGDLIYVDIVYWIFNIMSQKQRQYFIYLNSSVTGGFPY